MYGLEAASYMTQQLQHDLHVLVMQCTYCAILLNALHMIMTDWFVHTDKLSVVKSFFQGSRKWSLCACD